MRLQNVKSYEACPFSQGFKFKCSLLKFKIKVQSVYFFMNKTLKWNFICSCSYLKVCMHFAEFSPKPIFMQSIAETVNKFQEQSIPHSWTPNMMCNSWQMSQQSIILQIRNSNLCNKTNVALMHTIPSLILSIIIIKSQIHYPIAKHQQK